MPSNSISTGPPSSPHWDGELVAPHISRRQLLAELRLARKCGPVLPLSPLAGASIAATMAEDGAPVGRDDLGPCMGCRHPEGFPRIEHDRAAIGEQPRRLLGAHLLAAPWRHQFQLALIRVATSIAAPAAPKLKFEGCCVGLSCRIL